MAKEKLEDLSREQLLKRKKLALFVMGLCIGVFVFNIGVMVTLLVKGRLENISIFIPGFVLIMFVIMMFNGGKKINEELARRNDI